LSPWRKSPPAAAIVPQPMWLFSPSRSLSREPSAIRGHRHIVITGAMGVGKTTLARQLAGRLNRPWRDSDADIQSLLGISGAELAVEQSVEALHELERAVLLGALVDSTPLVIAAAASVVDNGIVRTALKRRAVVVGLAAPTSVIIERQRSGDHRRSMTPSDIDILQARRAEFRLEVEDLRLDAQAAPSSLADSVVEWLRDRRSP